MITSGVSGAFQTLKSAVQTRIITPISTVIDDFKAGKYGTFDDFKAKMVDLNTRFRDNILEPTKSAIKNTTIKTYTKLTTVFDDLNKAFKTNILDKLDEAYLKIKNLPETDAFKRIATIVDGFKDV